MKSKIIKNMGNFFRSAAVAYMLAALLVTATLLLTVFKEDYFVACFHKSEYYSGILKSVKADFVKIENNVALPALGLGTTDEKNSVTANKITLNNITDDVNAYVKACFNGKKYPVDTAQLEETLNEALLRLADESNVKVDERISAVLQDAAKTEAERYEYYVEISGLDGYTSLLARYKQPLSIALAVLCLLLAITVFFHFRFNAWPHRALRYLIYGISAAGLILFAAPLAFYIAGADSYASFTSNAHISKFALSYINGVLGYFILTGIALIALSVLLVAFVYANMYKNANK